jgi:hypothetical protein
MYYICVVGVGVQVASVSAQAGRGDPHAAGVAYWRLAPQINSWVLQTPGIRALVTCGRPSAPQVWPIMMAFNDGLL